MISRLIVDHEGEFVTFSGPEGKIARIQGEEAIALAKEVLDAAERSLRGVRDT